MSAGIVFFGSGAFGIPVLERLVGRAEVRLVVSQPDRAAGRGRVETPTPVAAWALEHGVPLLRTQDAGLTECVNRIREGDPQEFVVIAFGQKLKPELLQWTFAINLHGSLLPRWRGAAPVQRAVMEGDRESGVSVIGLAQRMDAGPLFGAARTPIGASETSGELHDRLASMGPDLVDEVLRKHRGHTLVGEAQDESRATRAPKLAKCEAWVDFAGPASAVAARINGLAPWPGCDARIGDAPLRLCRAREAGTGAGAAAGAGAGASAGAGAGAGAGTHSQDPVGPVGSITPDGIVTCGRGAVQLLEVQSPGSRVMPFAEWRRGHAFPAGSRASSAPAQP